MPILALVVALVLRLTYLYLNTSLDLPPIWFSVVHSSLRAAEHFMGVPLDQVQGLMGVPQAVNHYIHEIRAFTWIHMADLYIFGKTSLFRLSILGVLLDTISLICVYKCSAMVIKPQMRQLSHLTAWLYALSPVHIFMSVVPSWYTWLNFGVIYLVYYVLRAFESRTINVQMADFLFTSAILIFLSQCRATITMMPFFFAAALMLIYLYSNIFYSVKNKFILRGSLATLGLGILINISYGLSNRIITGEFFLGRKHIAHSFLMGIGEQKNSFAITNNLDGSDNSVYQYYFDNHLTLSKNHEPTVTAFSDVTYREWTRAQVKLFIIKYPVLYLRLILTRVVKQLIPNFRFSLVADVDAYAKNEPLEDRKNRLNLLKIDGDHSLKNILKFLTSSPLFVVDYSLRVIIMIFFPLSLIFGIKNLSKLNLAVEERTKFIILLLPMAYMLITLSLIRTPNFDHAAAWSALLPICAAAFLKKVVSVS